MSERIGQELSLALFPFLHLHLTPADSGENPSGSKLLSNLMIFRLNRTVIHFLVIGSTQGFKRLLGFPQTSPLHIVVSGLLF